MPKFPLVPLAESANILLRLCCLVPLAERVSAPELRRLPRPLFAPAMIRISEPTHRIPRLQHVLPAPNANTLFQLLVLVPIPGRAFAPGLFRAIPPCALVMIRAC